MEAEFMLILRLETYIWSAHRITVRLLLTLLLQKVKNKNVSSMETKLHCGIHQQLFLINSRTTLAH